MIDQFNKILDASRYSIINKNNSTEIYSIENNLVIPDEYINIQKQGSKYLIFVVSRDVKSEVAEVELENSDFAVAISIVLCKRIFECPSQDLVFIREIRNKVNNNGIENLEELFKRKIKNDFFSIENYKENVINLFTNGDKASVKYNQNYIVEDVKLSRAYVVMYNYVKLLEKFESIYKELTNYLKIDKGNYYLELRKYYIFEQN